MLVAFILWLKNIFHPGKKDDRNVLVENVKQVEDLYKVSGSILVRRKDASVAEWNEEAGMAVVKPRMGKVWNNTGVMRSGLLMCHVEEAVFQMEHGSLVLKHRDTPMQVEQVFQLLTVPRYGCNLEAYQVYAYFKALGYVIARHGVPWTDKQVPSLVSDTSEVPEADNLKLMFDVYPPNSQFKKTAPGQPSFSLCISRRPPRRLEVIALERESGLPVKFAKVTGEHVKLPIAVYKVIHRIRIEN